MKEEKQDKGLFRDTHYTLHTHNVGDLYINFEKQTKNDQ